MTGKLDVELEALRDAASRTEATSEEIKTSGDQASAALHKLQGNFDGIAAVAIGAFTSQFDSFRGTIAENLQSIAQAIHTSMENYEAEDAINASSINAAGQGTEGAEATNASNGSEEPNDFYDDDPRVDGGTVEEINDWWESLDEDAQQEILENNPQSIAELDGIPFGVRHEANAALLEAELAELNEQIENTDKGFFPFTDKRETYDDLVERRDALENLQSKFERDTQTMTDQEHLLLGFDSETDDVIMSIGNPDDAEYMVTYTPGTGMSMLDTDRFNTEISRGSNILDNMELEHGIGDDTAVVVYANFENPTKLTEAEDPHYIENGAEEFASFNEGLNHIGDFEQHTAIGHSAGGAHVGYAAASQDNFHADNVVYVASAGGGTDVGNASQLNADNVYSTMAQSDFLDTQADPDNNTHVHGGDPQSDRFGATTFESDNRSTRNRVFENHRGYFDLEIGDDGSVENRNAGLEGITDIAAGER